jgi:hypothetical protein
MHPTVSPHGPRFRPFPTPAKCLHRYTITRSRYYVLGIGVMVSVASCKPQVEARK